jgi:hypothetical protein
MALDGIQKLHSTTACSGGEMSNLCSPSGGHARKRERRAAAKGVAAAPRRWRGELVAFPSWEIMTTSSPLGSFI